MKILFFLDKKIPISEPGLQELVSSKIDKKYHNLILGIQGQLWSETLTKKSYFDEMINPRLETLAEVAWCSDNRRKWTEFRASLLNNMKFLTKLGWKFHNF